jgi:cell division septation protein DedD
MATYRLNLDRRTLLLLGTSGLVFCALIFASGGLVGLWMAPSVLATKPLDADLSVVAHASSPTVGDLELCLAPAPETQSLVAATDWTRMGAMEPLGISLAEDSDSAPVTEEVSPPAPVLPPPAPRFAVQVGAFGIRENAEALAADLRRRGHDPLIVSVRSRTGDWLSHVHVSLHEDESSAQAAARRISEEARLSALVVAAPPASERN